MSFDDKKEWFLIILGLLIGVPIIFGAFGVFLWDWLKAIYTNIDEVIRTIFIYALIIGGFYIVARVIGSIAGSITGSTSNKYSRDYEGYPYDWDSIRLGVLNRDDNQCGNCGDTTNLHVHHIVPLSKGGTNNLSNLRTLCENCHKRLHPHMK